MWVLYVPVTLNSLHSMAMGIGWAGVRCGGRGVALLAISKPTKCLLAAQRWNAYGRGGIRSCLIPSFVAFY